MTQVFSCEFCEIYKNTFFHRTTPVAASDWWYYLTINRYKLMDGYLRQVSKYFFLRQSTLLCNLFLVLNEHQLSMGSRLFICSSSDPYSRVS